MRFKVGFRKILSVIATSALLLNSVAPYSLAIAQEITPEPTPTPTEETTPTPEATIAPTESPTEAPTPTEIATPTPEVVVESTPLAEETTPAPDPTQPETQGTTSENTQSQAPPAESPTVTPSATPEVPQEHGNLTTTTIEDVDLSEVTLLNANVDGNSNITTDKADYHPTDIVLISGTGFTAHKAYTLEIISTDEPPVDFKDQIKADESGNIQYAYQLDGNYRPNYAVYVKTGENIVASTTFTDSKETTGNVSVDFDQCANDDNPTPAGQCNWIGSILQHTNSTYFEGMSVPQRILYQGITTPGDHTISFSYSYTKGGTHAYDFLTSLNQGNSGFSPGITNLDKCDGLTGGDATACNALVGLSPTNITIPNDPFDSKDSAPGVGTGTTQTQKENWYQGQFGTRQISVQSSNTFSSGSVSLSHTVGADGDTGDSDVNVSLSFNLANCSGASPCKLLVFFGGHLAVTGSSNSNGSDWGQPLGSSNINGGPYHIKSLKLDGNGGSLDNQIAGADIILPGTIVINKTSVGGNSTFNFTSTGGSTLPANFSITTASNSGSLTFNNVLAGSYSVTEAVQSAPWSFTSLQCTDPTGNTTTSSRTANINVAAGETVSCTYTNTFTNPTGTLNVHKLTDADANGTFETADTGSNTLGFRWGFSSTPSSNTNPFGTGVSENTGSYSVYENNVTNYHFVGWYPTGSTQYSCTNPQGTTLPVSATVSSNTTTEITLCNARDTGTLQVLKNVDLNGDGDYTDANETGATDWLWQANGGADHNTGDAAITVPTGNYALTETAKTNFHYVSLQCTGGTLTSNSVAVTTDANVVCTFTNARDIGTIQVVKNVVPDDSGVTGWDFSVAGPTANSVNDLQDGESSSIFTSMTGSYTVAETAHTGTLGSNYNTTYSCADNTGVLTSGSGTTTDSFSLATGKNVVCTFTNTIKNGTIIVQKNMIGGVADFVFTGDVAGTISTSGGQLSTSNVLPGTYSSVETITTGWDLNSIICNDGTSVTASSGDVGTRTATFELDPGETVTCIFTNTKRGHLIVQKTTVPAAEPQTFSITASGSGTITGGGAGTVTDALDKDYAVTPGTYSVTEAEPGNWIETSNNCTDRVVDAGETEYCQIVNTKKGHVTVVKYLDHNANGVKDAEDETLDEWWIHLGVWDQATGAQVTGQVTFSDIDPGQYTLSETIKAGWFQSNISCTGDTGIDSDNSHSVTVSPGQTTNCSIGNYQKGSIAGAKYEDSDGSLLTSGDQTGILNWAIELYTCTSNFTGCVLSATADTAANGSYSFTNLIPGYYQVKEIVRAGWYALTSLFHNVTITSNDAITGKNFVNTEYGSIVVEKQTLPNGSQQSFDFDLSFGDLDANLSDGQQDTTGTLTPGTYSIIENTPAGWDLTNVTCTDGSNPSAISLQSGETVTCVFTNTQRGHIVVDKVTYPSDSNQSFGFTAGGVGYTNFSLTDADTPNDQEVVPGAYSISEGAVSGWDSDDGICDLGETPASLDVGPGETVTCTFTNTQRGYIIVDKITDPSEDLQSFDFTATGSGYINFSLADLDTPDDQELLPGTYGVSESVPAGWDLIDTACESSLQDTETAGSLDLDPGETITCTFTNEKDANIIIAKETNPDGSLQTFKFETDYSSNFFLADGQTDDSGDLDPGTYSVSETLPLLLSGAWEQTSVVCDDGSNPSEIDLSAGETVTCTFTNTLLSDIHGFKWNDLNGNRTRDCVLGDNSQIVCIPTEPLIEGWTMNLYKRIDEVWVLQDSDTTDATGWYTFEGLEPGDYRVCEEDQGGWDQTYPAGGNCHEFSLPNGDSQSENEIVGPEYNFGNQQQIFGVNIEKSNDKSGGANKGDTVNYTLIVTNAGNQTIYNLDIKDSLPGGFSYVLGSTTNGTTADPTISGNNLTWEDVTDLAGGATITLNYQVKIDSGVSDGTYINFATCIGDDDPEEPTRTIDCNIDDSTVPIGGGVSFGGRLGQVLGLSTELPATGSPTGLALIALGLIGVGFILKKKYVKN